MGEQLRLEFDLVAISRGDILRVISRDEPYCFVNEIGFKTQNVPEGAKIRTQAYAICIGAVMPEILGIVHYCSGMACIYPADCLGKIRISKYNLLKLQEADIITVLNISEP